MKIHSNLRDNNIQSYLTLLHNSSAKEVIVKNQILKTHIKPHNSQKSIHRFLSISKSS